MSAAPRAASGREARVQVRGPATLLIITGAIGILLAMLGLLGEKLGPPPPPSGGMTMDPQAPEWFKTLNSESAMKRITMAMSLAMLTLNTLIFWGGLKMRKLESYRLAFAASILAIIPCFSCFLVGIPVGIWCVVVLSQSSVKEAFHAT